MYETPNTLAYYQGLPARKKMRNPMMVKDIGPRLSSYMKNTSPVQPDLEAVVFYALNQMVAHLHQKFTLHEPLPDLAVSVLGLYANVLRSQHTRLFNYTLTVITRESSHLREKGTYFMKNPLLGGGAGEYTLKKSPYADTLKEFVSALPSGSSPAAEYLYKNPPNIPLTDYTRGVADIFNQGSFNGGYGGKPWGNIATTLHRFVNGDTSAEVFIDTAYTLAHNNGPMFNKGMVYSMYTDKFIMALDVQRSGQVCEGLLDGTFKHLIGPAAENLLTLIQKFQSEYGGIGDKVDWKQVQDLGAVGNYSSKFSSSGITPAKPKPIPKKLPPTVATINGKEMKVALKKEVEILPGKTVYAMERVK